MSHSDPNSANIYAAWPKDNKGNPIPPKNAVEEIKKDYDDRLRALWTTNHYLVGTDADGIQLRILAHYMDSDAYRHAILSGDKAKGTDIHSLNMHALGPICRSRDSAKTFIYAWLLGAGLGEVGRILDCGSDEAQEAVQNFLDSLPELKKIKQEQIPADAKRGYFVGLDGRRVNCTSKHLMLAGYLQNGEAVVMKHANVLWRRWADEEGINYKQVNFVHDEWVTECVGYEEEAERLGVLQKLSIKQAGEDLGVRCPLEGQYAVGKNWYEVH